MNITDLQRNKGLLRNNFKILPKSGLTQILFKPIDFSERIWYNGINRDPEQLLQDSMSI
jgi:hypothetical protein